MSTPPVIWDRLPFHIPHPRWGGTSRNIPDPETRAVSVEPKPRCATIRAGNPYYPLPADYGDLSTDAARDARIWACSKNNNPDEFVESWALFREMYLRPVGPPDANFYRGRVYNSPACHYQWIHDFAEYPRNLIAAPRGSAKSVVLGTELPLLLALTQPRSTTTLVMATDALINDRLGSLQQQFQENEYLQSDFGFQKPPKGYGTWNLHRLNLLNGSRIEGASVQSRKRGLRPTALILDDPEFDPTHEFEETSLLENLENLLFRQLLPMLDPGARMIWIGTMLSRRAALWASCMGTDPRFRMWNRRVYGLTNHNTKTGKITYLWSEKWDAAGVAHKRRELGEAAYQAECENNPVSASDRTLHIEDPYDTYSVVGGKVMWYTSGTAGVPEPYDAEYAEWVDGLARLFTVDPALNKGGRSDPSAILCVGIDKERVWWVLDLFLGQVSATGLADEIYRMGLEWQPSLVGIESVAFADVLRGSVELKLDDLTSGTAWQPKVYPVTYPPRMSKSARIERLSARNSRHGIKFPTHMAHTIPMKYLFQQVRDFTMDLALLPNDDAVDALSMVQYCPRIHPSGIDRSPTDDSAVAQLLAGRTHDMVTGLPLSLYINPQMLSAQDSAALFARRHDRAAKHSRYAQNSTAQELLAKMGSALTDLSRTIKN